MAEDTNGRIDPQAQEPTWSRRQLLVGTAGLAVAGAMALFGKKFLVNLARNIVGSPVSSGKIYLYQFDYYFVPNYMTWRVGDHVEVVLQNQSPTHWHEWAMGRQVNQENFQGFGELPADAWRIDFWDGVKVTLSDPYKIDNFVPHKALVTYVGPKGPYQISDGGDFSPTLQPGGSLHLSFTVPDKPGIWYYGCFVQQFIHYRTGMRGIVNILPA